METTNHYYRVKRESDLGKSLNELIVKGTECMNAAGKMAGEVFKADSFTPSTGCAMGGIGQLFFRRKPTARRWEILGKTPDGLYCVIPNPATRSGCLAVEKMITLPIVKNSDVVRAFGMEPTEDIAIPMFFPLEEQYIYVSAKYEIEGDDLTPVSDDEYYTALNYYETGLTL